MVAPRTFFLVFSFFDVKNDAGRDECTANSEECRSEFLYGRKGYACNDESCVEDEEVAGDAFFGEVDCCSNDE